MNELTKRIKIFVSSPSDLMVERERLSVVAEELNRSICPKLNVFLQLIQWETNTVPSMGRPQQIILDQIGQYDIFIGIMWKRFGSPTGKAESGTKEEFDEAYKKWKEYENPRIMFYFNQMPYVLKNAEEAEQLKMVLQFRAELQNKGLIREFTGPDQFERCVREHLTTVVYEIAQKDKQVKEVLLLSFDLDLPAEANFDKYTVLKKIIPHIVQSANISADEIIDRVLYRENLGTTGIGFGIAMPHVYGTLYSKHIVAIIKSPIGIKWQSLDDEPVFIIVTVLYAHQRNDITLGALTLLSRAALFVQKKEGRIKADSFLGIIEKTKESLKERFRISEHRKLPNLVINDE